MKLPILYVDTFLTDSQLHVANPNFQKIFEELKEFRINNKLYRHQSKIDIFKYTLLSYSYCEWKNVYISFECENKEWVNPLLEFISTVFPNAVVHTSRSDTVAKFLSKVSKIGAKDDDWIYFCPNNDHPVVHQKFVNFGEIIKDAEEVFDDDSSTLNTISLSHFPEYVNSIEFNTPLYLYNGIKYKVIVNDEDKYVLETNDVYLDSLHLYRYMDVIHILNSSADDIGRVVRFEDLKIYHSKTFTKHRVYCAKHEICRHYDGYNHTRNYSSNYINFDVCPPLFIPSGILSGCIDNKFYSDISEIPGNRLNDHIPYFWNKYLSPEYTNCNFATKDNDNFERFAIKMNRVSMISRSVLLEVVRFINKFRR